MDPADDEQCIAWARETYAAMQPVAGLGRYVNYLDDYLDDDEPGDPAAAAYGAKYRRLREIKAEYDPENFFHMNQNIRPFSWTTERKAPVGGRENAAPPFSLSSR